ncbi:MAG: histidine kinase [Actinomycetota bacterium]|nr:histidine kinase [Actinomycetota bacterium]
MGTEHRLIARIRTIDLRVIDWAVAALLTVGALADASSQLRRGLGALTIVSLLAMAGSVAWRRRHPALTTLVAITGFMAFQLASGYAGGGAFEVAAIALNFYLLGRGSQGRESARLSAAVFVYWLAGVVMITYDQAGASVGAVLGAWALLGGLPYAFGWTLETRNALTRELKARMARLEDEQALRARRAAGEERNRMARELHDVIAHSVSVMVIQTSGGRRAALGDLEVAGAALRVVESSGRDALVELRRIVGALHHSSDELAGPAAPGLSQLDALADRARAAGLAVELHVDSQPRALPPGLDLVAYRVVQEALTNTIKHAGPAQARVNVSVGTRDLTLEVLDTGKGLDPTGRNDREPGHGLVGMGERVRLYGGELHTGPRAGGGFEVRTRIPLEGSMPSPLVLATPGRRDEVTIATAAALRWPWLDSALAGTFLVVLEIGVLAESHRRGPLALNMLIVSAMALAAHWRRRFPMSFLVAIGTLAALMNEYLTSLARAPLTAAYVLLIPAYTVAAWTDRRRALLGLAVVLCGAALSGLVARHQPVGNLVGAAFTITAAWAAGQAIRGRRVLAADLEAAAARLEAEREDREQLAVAGERSRIVRELHAVVAQSVAAMVVQAEAARAMLERDPARADTAMGAIEDTGRQTLAEMRRILGVLRHAYARGELEPQPGVAQIYALIQRSREDGQRIELTVDGDPGTLPAGVDLGLYRILEEALHSAPRQLAGAVGVALRFDEETLELRLTARRPGPNGWPTDVMRARVALCDGELHAESRDENGWQFVARMPRGLQGALG